MLTIVLIVLYALGFVALFLGLLLLDDKKATFADAMIKLAAIIIWPLVLAWYLLETAGIRRKIKKTDTADAPMEANPWI